jgi:hypothetical protein
MKEKIKLKPKPKRQDFEQQWIKEIEEFKSSKDFKQNINNLGWFCIARSIGMINLHSNGLINLNNYKNN